MSKIVALQEEEQINLDSCPECRGLDVVWDEPEAEAPGEVCDMRCICYQCGAEWVVEVVLKEE